MNKQEKIKDLIVKARQQAVDMALIDSDYGFFAICGGGKTKLFNSVLLDKQNIANMLFSAMENNDEIAFAVQIAYANYLNNRGMAAFASDKEFIEKVKELIEKNNEK